MDVHGILFIVTKKWNNPTVYQLIKETHRTSMRWNTIPALTGVRVGLIVKVWANLENLWWKKLDTNDHILYVPACMKCPERAVCGTESRVMIIALFVLLCVWPMYWHSITTMLYSRIFWNLSLWISETLALGKLEIPNKTRRNAWWDTEEHSKN